MNDSYFDVTATSTAVLSRLGERQEEFNGFADGIHIVFPAHTEQPIAPWLGSLKTTLHQDISRRFSCTVRLSNANIFTCNLADQKGLVVLLDWSLLSILLRIEREYTGLVREPSGTNIFHMRSWLHENKSKYILVAPPIGETAPENDLIFWSLDMDHVREKLREETLKNIPSWYTLPAVASLCGSLMPWELFFDVCASKLTSTPDDDELVYRRCFFRSVFEYSKIFTCNNSQFAVIENPTLFPSSDIDSDNVTYVCDLLRNQPEERFKFHQVHVANMLMHHIISATPLDSDTHVYWAGLRDKATNSPTSIAGLELIAIHDLHGRLSRLNPHILLNDGAWIYNLAKATKDLKY